MSDYKRANYLKREIELAHRNAKAAERRLRTLHCIYSETKDMRVLRKVQLAKLDVQRIAKRIEAVEGVLK